MIHSAFHRNSAFAYQPKPKTVFISNTTELGTVYKKAELAAIAATCKELNLLLLLDSARLGAALSSRENDSTLPDIYVLTDIFWHGGAKNSALLGEAVIKDPVFGAWFPYHMKQRGVMLAKGRVIGAQFCALLQDGLWLELARHANAVAEGITGRLVGLGYELWASAEVNQVFVCFFGEVGGRGAEGV